MTDEATAVKNRADRRRYEITRGDTLIGFAEYVDTELLNRIEARA